MNDRGRIVMVLARRAGVKERQAENEGRPAEDRREPERHAGDAGIGEAR